MKLASRKDSVALKPASQRNTTSSSVNRAFAILDILSSQGSDGAALMETAQRLRLSKSTTHRYLMTLERLGAIERDEKDRFHLGLKMIELAGLTLSNNDLRKRAETFLTQLQAATQETVHLAVPSGTEVVYIGKADSPHAIRMYSHIGARAPMYCTSLGKAMLAFSGISLINEVIRGGLPARTEHTITTRQALLKELERIRSQGFAIDDEENEDGVSCVGSPVFDYSAKPIGAISVSGPAERITRPRQAELGPMVRAVCLRLSKQMGYAPT